MKKIVLLICLLVAYIGNSQNQEMIGKMIESKSLEDIRMLSNNIVSKSNHKYDFYKIKSLSRGADEKYQYVIYTKEGMTDAEKKELSANRYADCLVVEFKEWQKGENKDLEIKGELVYFFKEVSGTYLELFEFWKTTFYPSVTKEQLLEDYKMQEYRVNKDLKYKFRKDQDVWTISKSY